MIEAFDGKYLKFVKLIEGEDDDDDGVDVLKNCAKSRERCAGRWRATSPSAACATRRTTPACGCRRRTSRCSRSGSRARLDDIDGDKLQRALSKGDASDDDDDKILRKLSKEVKRLNREDRRLETRVLHTLSAMMVVVEERFPEGPGATWYGV